MEYELHCLMGESMLVWCRTAGDGDGSALEG